MKVFPVPNIERVVELSHIRRGRLATRPTWFVNLPSGQRWRFQRKKDAVAFADIGGCVHRDTQRGFCWQCEGAPVETRAQQAERQ